MFKTGDKVEYIGNTWQSLRGQEHEVVNTSSWHGGEKIQIKARSYLIDGKDFMLSTKGRSAYVPPIVKVGDRVRLKKVSAAAAMNITSSYLEQEYICKQANCLKDSCYITVGLLDLYVSGAAAMHSKDCEVELIELSVAKQEANAIDGNLDAAKHVEQTEGDRMMAFFKSSAHDKKAVW